MRLVLRVEKLVRGGDASRAEDLHDGRKEKRLRRLEERWVEPRDDDVAEEIAGDEVAETVEEGEDVGSAQMHSKHRGARPVLAECLRAEGVQNT